MKLLRCVRSGCVGSTHIDLVFQCWGRELRDVIHQVEQAGAQVVATIADNANNAQRVVTDNVGLNLNCIGHVANLLMKDLMTLFARQVDQAKEIETLFRGEPITHRIFSIFFSLPQFDLGPG